VTQREAPTLMIFVRKSMFNACFKAKIFENPPIFIAFGALFKHFKFHKMQPQAPDKLIGGSMSYLRSFEYIFYTALSSTIAYLIKNNAHLMLILFASAPAKPWMPV
jgi:hypothetical protein